MTTKNKKRTQYIEGIERTKTYNYLFEPSITMFHNESVLEVFNSYVSGIRIINIFLGDKAEGTTKYKLEDGVYHILCDLSGPHATSRLKQLKSSQYYVDSYIINREPKAGVILFRAFKGKAYNNFLTSEYNKMYTDTLLEAVKDRFVKSPVKRGKDKEYKHAFRVLSDDPALRDAWAKRMHVDPDEVVQLASKLNLNKEVVNIKEYYDEICDKV